MLFCFRKSAPDYIFYYIYKFNKITLPAFGQTKYFLFKGKSLSFSSPTVVNFTAKREFCFIFKNEDGKISEKKSQKKGNYFIAEAEGIEFETDCESVECSFYSEGNYTIYTPYIAGDVILFTIITLSMIISFFTLIF